MTNELETVLEFGKVATEYARINADDGSCSFDWPLIEETARQWKPGNTDVAIGTCKLLVAASAAARGEA